MEPIWSKPELANEIIKEEGFDDHIPSIITDILSNRLDITHLVENMGGVLTNKEPENRQKGMYFFTQVLKGLPKEYLSQLQLKFISKFYTDRLKDNHRVLPPTLEGYLTIVDMKNYNIEFCTEFLTILFREVSCQSQVRQDRLHIYLIIQKLMEKNIDFMKNLGPDFVYGVISSIDSERDPRNLLFVFAFLQKFLSQIPVGHLVEEMFDVVSCYYPIDFHPSPNDPAAVTRQDLATALEPCLCAVPEFGEQCLVLLIEKLDSNLRLAKLDSLRLLKESCKTFKPEAYIPFLKALWSSISREINHKTDDELKMAAHEALSALVTRLSQTANTDQAFETFVKGILIYGQQAIAETTTVANFVQTARILMTTANASEVSCFIITKSMIPAIIAYYEFKTSPKLQVASIEFVGDLYDIAKKWAILNSIESQIHEIPQFFLNAVSQPLKEFQIAGFKALIRLKNVLKEDLVLPFAEVLIHNIQHSKDQDLLSVSVETVHVIATKYPELIMDIVVKGKCDLDNITRDKTDLQKRLNLLSNLASIDDFTKLIIEEMLKLISSNDTEAGKVVEAMNVSISNTSYYSEEKLSQIESDHGLIDSILTWILKEIKSSSEESLNHGYVLIANTISSLPSKKQSILLDKHTSNIVEKCKTDETYYLILQSLYSSVHQCLHNTNFNDIMEISLNMSLKSENEAIRTKACVLVAHFLNKAEYGQQFELLYELLKNFLTNCSRENMTICPRLVLLYGWITKALITRGSDLFFFWLQKITVALSSRQYCKHGSEAIQILVSDYPEYLSKKQHCRVNLLYKQRVFHVFAKLTEKFSDLEPICKEAYLLSWGYVLAKVPKTVLNNEVNKIASLVIDALDYDNTELLLVMLDVLCHFIETKQAILVGSLQTILPRLIKLSTYDKSMDVRMKSLQCMYSLAAGYPTPALLSHKQDVVLALAAALDDDKRRVRAQAVRARTRWFLVGAPGERKDD